MKCVRVLAQGLMGLAAANVHYVYLQFCQLVAQLCTFFYCLTSEILNITSVVVYKALHFILFY